MTDMKYKIGEIIEFWSWILEFKGKIINIKNGKYIVEASFSHEYPNGILQEWETDDDHLTSAQKKIR